MPLQYAENLITKNIFEIKLIGTLNEDETNNLFEELSRELDQGSSIKYLLLDLTNFEGLWPSLHLYTETIKRIAETKIVYIASYGELSPVTNFLVTTAKQRVFRKYWHFHTLADAVAFVEDETRFW